MSQTSPVSNPRSDYQAIFDSALTSYRRKTGKNLTSDPLFCDLETCSSPDAIIAVLRARTHAHGQPQNSSDESLRWLNPTINALYAFSGMVGNTVGLSYPPVGVICASIGILLSAAGTVTSSRDLISGLFERIEGVFKRMANYVEIPRTAGMTDVIVKVMVEVLNILAIATKKINEHRAKAFLKTLVGRSSFEDALQRLEEVTVEEARMAAVEALMAIYGVGTSISDALKIMKAIENRMKGMEGILHDRLQGVDDGMKDISGKAIKVAENTGLQIPIDFDAVATEGPKSARIHDTQEGVFNRAMDAEIAQDIGARVIDSTEKPSGPIASNFVDSSRDQLRQDSMEWLSPSDPAMNYNTARHTRHPGTAVWFTEGSMFKNWKESASLLWIHGKPGSGKSTLTSAIIEAIERISNTETAYMAYFFFDFNDAGKQDARALLASILVQLSSQSAAFCNILLELYLAHQHGSKRPSESNLFPCLKKMLSAPGTVPIYLIIDALDECPGTSKDHSPRAKVLELLEELVGLQLPNLHLCVSSRFETDITNVLEPLTSKHNRISLHDEDGQKKDIARYVSFVVKTMKWREKDKELVIRALSIRNGRVFRWVSCQIEALRRSLESSVIRVVEELPQTLDETYERILQKIPKANRVHAHRLLECLTVAARPLRVEELAEVLAIDFSASGAIPKLNEDWRWNDQGQAIITACSTLVAVVDIGDSQVVQFSHSSVKDFLTSDQLATSQVGALRYHHIRLEPAHTVMAQACIAVLLRLESPIGTSHGKRFPLADYAANHFADHAEFGNVISHITPDGIDNLLDEDKPHFTAWMSHLGSSSLTRKDSGRKLSPLYELASLKYYRLVHHLILRRPQNMIVGTSVLGLSVHAAPHQGDAQACQSLLPRCIDVDVRTSDGQTPLHVAARHALLDVARMIIGQGADMNARDNNGWTPLQEAAFRGHFDIAQLLLQYGANVNVRNKDGWSPLHEASCYGYLDIVQLLLEHGSDRNAMNDIYCTPLHLAASHGQLSAVRLLVENGVNIHAQNKDNWTPIHEATFHNRPDIIRLLLKHGATVHVRNKDDWTLLHEASCYGYLEALQLVLEQGADLEATNDMRCTPLHLAAGRGQLAAVQLLVEHGANVHAQTRDKWTPIHEATFHNHPDIIRLLLKHGATVHVRNKDDWTLLHEASCYGYLEALQLLLEQGADLEATNDRRCTPLHLAAAKGQLAAVQMLVEHGANVHALTRDRWTPIHEATFHNHPDIIRLLLKHGTTVHVRNKDDWTLLHEASCYGYLEALQLLLEQGADLEATNDRRCTPLHLAAAKGQLAAVRLLVERGANVHAQTRDKWTPIHEATFHNHPDIMRLLLKHGATVHVRNKDDWTLLHEASCYGYLEALQLLLERGADLNATNDLRCTPLHLAASRGQFAATKLLVEQGVNIHMSTKDGWTPLYEATFNGHPDIVLFLLEHGASVHMQNKHGWTPLHEASFRGFLNIIQLLLAHGANLEAMNDECSTPLHLAARNGRLAVAQLLVEQGAIVGVQNKSGRTPLHEASFHRHSDIVMLLLERTANGRRGQRAYNSAT